MSDVSPAPAAGQERASAVPPAGIEPAKPATGENDDKAPVFEGIMGTRRPPGRRYFRKHKCRKNLRKSQQDWRTVRHAAPRPQTVPSPFTTRKQKRGDGPAHEPGIEPGTVSTETFWRHSCKTKTLHTTIHKTIWSRNSPTSWGAILFSTCTPCGERYPRPACTPCGGKKANPNLGCPPLDDATQPAPEPHPPPHHRDAHPAPHPKQASKPQTSPPKSA